MPSVQQSPLYRAITDDKHFLHSSFRHDTSTNTPPHILFDCDGLILDTEPIYSLAAISSLRHFTRSSAIPADQLFPESLKLKVMGGTKSQVSQQMADHLNTLLSNHNNQQQPLISADDWATHTTPLETHHFSLGCPLMPGIVDLVSLVKSKGFKAAVATSSARESFLLKSGPHSALFAAFDAITCGDDPEYSDPAANDSDRPQVKGKPHPSIFRTARHHLNRTAQHHGIVLEDSPNGVVAALRSGHSCIWVPAKRGASFDLIDDILRFETVKDDLWVYRADSLYEVIEALK